MKHFEDVKQQLAKMNISDYSYVNWHSDKRYKEMYGFLAGMYQIAIRDQYFEAESVFRAAMIELINIIWRS